MNKFGVEVHKFEDEVDAELVGKYVLIKEDYIHRARPKLFLRRIISVANNNTTETISDDINKTLITTVPHVSNARRGTWSRDNLQGWVSVEDAEKIMVWESLEHGLV